MSLNKLFEEMTTQTIAEFDTEVRFRALAAAGDTHIGLGILEKIDVYFDS